jgi:hypothetical protein
MAVAKGFLTVAGFKKAATWGTPVTCATGDGIEIISESVAGTRELIEDMQITGAASQRGGDAGNMTVGGDLVTAARYEGLEPITAQVFGTAGVPTTVDTTAYQHKLKLANALDGIFGTLAIQKQVEVHEIDSAKITGFSFKCDAGQRAEITYRVAGRNLAENTSSGTNNNTTASSITLPSNRAFLLFRQLVVRINAQSGAAFGTTDKVWVAGVSLDVDRAVKGDLFTTQGGYLVDEGIQDGFTKVTGTITFAKFETGTGGNDTLFAAQLAKTAKKMDWTFTGDSLAGSTTQYFQWVFNFPYVQFTEGTPQVGGPGIVTWSANFSAFRTTAAPTGMTGVTEPVELHIFSQRATDPLA